jgi:hypothetical protein
MTSTLRGQVLVQPGQAEFRLPTEDWEVCDRRGRKTDTDRGVTKNCIDDGDSKMRFSGRENGQELRTQKGTRSL